MARRTQPLGGESAFLGGAVCSRRRSGRRGFARVLDDNRAAGDSPETPTLMMLPKLIGVKLTVAYLAFWLVYSVGSGILVGWIL